MKRPRHVCSTVSSFLALSVPIAALLALTTPAVGGAATPSRWTVAADSGAAPPPPAPVAAPPAAPAPAPADTAAKLPPPAAPTSPAPAPVDTTGAHAAPMAAPADTTAAPAPATVPPVVTPAPPPAPPPPLTPKQARALEKQKKHDAKVAARAAKHPKKEKKAKKADVDPLAAWNRGKTWVTLRAGFVTSTEPGSGGGAIGAGLGLQRFITSRWSLGLTGDGDLLGKFGAAAEIEYPVTLQLMRHFRWQTALRPYLGAGGGAYYHKFFRTGDDVAQWKGGSFLTAGANMPVTGRSVLGFDGRMAFVSGDPSKVNPVFGNQRAQLTHYSLKLGWSLAF